MSPAAEAIDDTRKLLIGRAGLFELVDGIFQNLLADDVRWTIEGYSLASKTYPSRDAFMSEVIRPFNARMREPLKPSIRNVYAEGDTVIVFFDARGIARDGVPYANTYAWFLDLRNDRIVRASQYYVSRHPHLVATSQRFDVIFLAPRMWPRHVMNAFNAS